MDFYSTIALFILGLYILVKGAQILVRGAESVARFFGLSDWFIGLAIVGIGTSLPELAVALVSGFSQSQVGLGTLFGNNTFNALVILGIAGLFSPVLIKKEWIHDFLFSLAGAALAAIFIFFPVLGEAGFSGITRSEGLVLLTGFIAWLVYAYFRVESKDSSEHDKALLSIFTSFIFIIGGIIGVFVGGSWVVGGAEKIAETFGISSSVVGLLVVGVGTALSDFAVSVVAIFKRNPALAIGNIVGTNFIHFLGIPGLVSLVHPFFVSDIFRFDIVAPLAASLLVAAFIFLGRPRALDRTEGALLLLAYFAYFILFAIRG